MIGDIWIGDVCHTSEESGDDRGGVIMVKSPLWPSLPVVGARVEIKVIYESPYLTLVEDD